jgi:hypothetical protein
MVGCLRNGELGLQEATSSNEDDSQDGRTKDTRADCQAPLQLNSLTGTYATSTYLAALRKSPKDLESLAKDIESFDKKIKEDAKVNAFIRWYLSH